MEEDDLLDGGESRGGAAPQRQEPRTSSAPLTLLAEQSDVFGGLTPEALMGEARKFTDPEAPFRARAAGYLKPAASFSESYGNALAGYADAKTKQEELAAKYFPIVARVAQQRQQAIQTQLANQRALLDATAGASLMDQGLTREKLESQVGSLVQQGRVPGQMAADFLKTLPQDPTQLRQALTTAALARQDPYRAVQKPELRNVAEGANLVAIDPVRQDATLVASGAPKRLPFEKALEKLMESPPGSLERAHWERYLQKLMSHPQPTQVHVSTEKPLISSFMDTLGKNLATAHDAAQGAVGTLGTTRTLLGILNNPKLFVGPGADAAQVLARLSEFGGFGGRDNRERLANTKLAIQQIAQLELDAAAQMRGQGAITENERVILRRASAGDIGNDLNEILASVRAIEQRALKRIRYYNQRAEQLRAIPGLERVAPLIQVDEGDPTSMPTVVDFDANGKPLARTPGMK